MINEASIEKIFDNNLSPSVQLTPSKRQQIDNNEQTSSVSKRRGIKYTNEDIPTKFNKILVQDTPTPFMNRRIKSTSDAIVQNSANNTNNKESSKKQNRIIPNTPVIRSLTQSTKKVKKLFDNNALLLEEEEELPGVEIDLRKNITESSKKFSSLFKPKLKQNDKENENDYGGCELSFETLERRQRRKNHLVARLSEIEDLKLKYETKNQSKQNDELKLIEEKQNDNIYPSSPILTKVNSDQIDSETYNSEFTKILSKTPKTAEKLQSKFITFNHSSFTNVTENEFDMKTTRWTQNKTQTLIETNSLNENEISSELNEDEIDLILFNGLKIDIDKTKINSNRTNKMFRLVDKTNTSDKSIRSVSNTSEKRNAKIVAVKDNKKRSSSATLEKNKKYFPNQIKKFNFSFFDLDKNQEEFLNKTIEKLKLVDSPTNKNKKTCIKCTLNKQFSFNTTHLIIDFQRTFENNNIDTNAKFLLILAALKNCKLIRYEWLNHSYMKNKWIDESRYLIQSYITSDLDEYDQNEFDIKLIRFIRNLDLTSKISLFSHYGNIYILNDLPDDLDSVEINQNDECESENENENKNESLSFQKFSDSFSIYKSKEKTNDFILELITKCDGLVTSRVACADLIVAIDRKDDFDMSNELDKLFLKKQSNYLENCFRDIKAVLKKMRQKRNLQVISSSWIIDCVLENSKLNKDEYEVGWIRVKDQQE